MHGQEWKEYPNCILWSRDDESKKSEFITVQDWNMAIFFFIVSRTKGLKSTVVNWICHFIDGGSLEIT